MPEQGSLFAAPKARDPPPRPPRFRLPLEKREVKNPWGARDSKGDFFWEKMHKELEKMPEPMREHFNHLTAGTNPEHLEAFEKALRMFNRATNFDRIDFDVSRGRMREGE